MKRVAAVLLAVAMIVGAVLLRERIDGDDDDGGGGGGGGGGQERISLRCDTPLADICAQVASQNGRVRVTVEPAGTTADQLSSEDAVVDFDAWVTTSGWPGIVADNRSFAGLDPELLAEPSGPLARSPIMIATRSDGRAALEEACGGSITWRCIGEQVPPQRVGLPDPERGDGLAVLAAATDSWFGGDDYSTVDFEDPDFGRWFDDLTRLAASTDTGRQTPLARALAATGTFTTVGALEAETSQLLDQSSTYVPIYADPMVTADVVLAPRAGLEADALLDRIGGDELRSVLAERGWRIDGAAPSGAQDAPSLPEGTKLPSAGVLQALRERW